MRRVRGSEGRARRQGRARDDLSQTTRGDLRGPYVSQFVLLPFPNASAVVDQMRESPLPGTDWMADWSSALAAQNGVVPRIDGARRVATVSRIPRYVRNGRDLAWFCGSDDYPVQPFVTAALILKALGAPLNPINPYRRDRAPARIRRPRRRHRRDRGKGAGADVDAVEGEEEEEHKERARLVANQNNVVHLGFADAIDALSKVGASALKAAWYHKWSVHQRARPEALGMLAEKAWRTRTNPHGLHPDLLGSPTMKAVERRQGTLLLSQVFPSGAPCHPSYPSAHATVASACACVLKAFFDGDWAIPDAVRTDAEGTVLQRMVPRRSEDVRRRSAEREKSRPSIGTALRRRSAGDGGRHGAGGCGGNGAGEEAGEEEEGDEAPLASRLRLGDEIDKLASNIGLGRCFAGAASRSDVEAGWELGEKVAVRTLHDLSRRYAERSVAFRFRSRDGLIVHIAKDD